MKKSYFYDIEALECVNHINFESRYFYDDEMDYI